MAINIGSGHEEFFIERLGENLSLPVVATKNIFDAIADRLKESGKDSHALFLTEIIKEIAEQTGKTLTPDEADGLQKAIGHLWVKKNAQAEQQLISGLKSLIVSASTPST